MSRDRGLLRQAQVQVKPANGVTLVEPIAHELEHVLEQGGERNIQLGVKLLF